MDILKNYLTERGGSIKADLIRKVLAADLLQLHTLPSQEEKNKEIARRRVLKLKGVCMSIPFSEVIMQGCKEGANLQRANHVINVEFNNISDCIKYGFIRGEKSKKLNIVWVCLNLETCQIPTSEYGSLAGYRDSYKHVFALLHFILHHVSLGRA